MNWPVAWNVFIRSNRFVILQLFKCYHVLPCLISRYIKIKVTGELEQAGHVKHTQIFDTSGKQGGVTVTKSLFTFHTFYLQSPPKSYMSLIYIPQDRLFKIQYKVQCLVSYVSHVIPYTIHKYHKTDVSFYFSVWTVGCFPALTVESTSQGMLHCHVGHTTCPPRALLPLLDWLAAMHVH